MSYSTDLDEALNLVPEVALSATTTPTATQGGVIFAGVTRRINFALAGVGVTLPVSPSSSDGYKLIADIEARLTSGEILRAVHGMHGNSTGSQADQLLADGQAMLDALLADPASLGDMGVTSGLPGSASQIGDTYATENDQVDLVLDAVVEPEFHMSDEV